ncbi:MAG: prepilin-type N-terminal cleavage/methylation domain-containing protein, partial [Candidatus Brocadiia bacterium]
MQTAKCKVQNAKFKVNDAGRSGLPRRARNGAAVHFSFSTLHFALCTRRRSAAARNSPVVHFSFSTLHFALCTRRRRPAALTLIEILIAMFIFLVGCLGVLSVFPVAGNNAGRVLGETRGNMLAASVVSQISADCRVNFELPTTGSAAAVTPQVPLAPVTSSLTREPVADYPLPTPAPSIKTGYFVTLLDGPGRGQSRFITNDPGNWSTTITVAPAWTPVPIAVMSGNPPVLTQILPNWTGPGSLATQVAGAPYFPNEHYTITRMGLPERPLLAGDLILQGQQTTLNPQPPQPPPQTPYYVYQ